MAKWGEGDPRWIVEERPDATNVNNWHWTEKNATGWSKDKLKELLEGLVVENNDVFCEILTLTSIEGEASANNRKAKLIFFYEWVIKAEWSGKLKEGTKKYKGKFEIPNLSEENDADEIDVTVTMDKNTDEATKIKEFFRVEGTKQIQLQMAKYIKQLKEEFSQNIILPTKGEESKMKKIEKPCGINSAKEEMNKMVLSSQPANKSVGVKILTKVLNGKEEFRCEPPQLYRALTDKEMVQAFTGGPVTLELERGGRFTFMNGYVTGEIVDLVPDKKIVQRWRMKPWPDAHFSEVTLEMEPTDDGMTVLKLKQTGVPSDFFEKTMEGWKVNYWQRIKQVFGYGGRLF